MAFTTIRAARAGTCARCSGAFAAGTKVRYGRGKCYHLAAECPKGNLGVTRAARRRGPADGSLGALHSHHDPRGIYSVDGQFLGTIGPRCEDAPCCGCCS